MATIGHKWVHGHKYYQILQSQRINGKPRPIVLAHLGTAETLLQKLKNPQKTPYCAKIFDFGALAALWSIAQDLHLQEIIDHHSQKRNQGIPVSSYILIASLARALAPLPKTKVAKWYAHTILRRLLPIKLSELTSQRFWDHMDYLEPKALLAIQQDLAKAVLNTFEVDTRTLFFDATNFDTYIDTANPSKLSQRGHAKSKRTDLRIISLALLVSADFHIPLFWDVYPGNRPDSIEFAKVLPRLHKQYKNLAASQGKRVKSHITVVFDKGNNSEKNITRLSQTPYHIIGSLVPSQHEDLLEIPLNHFKKLPPEFGPTYGFRTEKEIFGRSWTIVITKSRILAKKQIRGIWQHLKKKILRLKDLQGKLAKSQKSPKVKKGKGYTLDSLTKHAKEIGSGQYMKEILKIKVGEKNKKLFLDYHVDTKGFHELKQKVLGKRILFTDNSAWSDSDIVYGYRGQHNVERAFRDMKDRALIQVRPFYHWSDHKAQVHILTCIIALILMGLIHHKVTKAGIKTSRQNLMENLKGIREVINIWEAKEKTAGKAPEPILSEAVLSETTEFQNDLIRALNLTQYLAR
jgi:transposase